MYNRKIRGPLIEGNKSLVRLQRRLHSQWKCDPDCGGILLLFFPQ
jgi:hypothetical protein